MRQTPISLPELALIAGTRAALGAGIGLLVSSHLSENARRAVGWTLVGVGVLSTLPLAYDILSRSQPMMTSDWIKDRPLVRPG
jgi:hypothetical protein